ncbi:DUF2182 domain-containing protein [Geodermatophilus bullaregiensis]|uniref:DUF2182 domain-containing protein n=1 Tax=Geodermatophilus bullaregiensis TaxID=1564160 RepID=UPI003556EBAE
MAAGYELSPLEDACLGRCRSPLGFLLGVWRDGRRGALRMGAQHGAWCVGCCWALMASLFALGVMSVTWTALVAGVIALEKTLPWRRVATCGTAVVLLVLGALLLAAPKVVPGLTVPGSGQVDQVEPMASWRSRRLRGESVASSGPAEPGGAEGAPRCPYPVPGPVPVSRRRGATGSAPDL